MVYCFRTWWFLEMSAGRSSGSQSRARVWRPRPRRGRDSGGGESARAFLDLA
uniref:Uncharacterized protein n=1 Tax=Arundo donax TaxID=35708 RepID=A0A0A9H8K6_ARUDO